MTITGTSLDGDVTVMVDGLPCVVKEVSLTEIICTTAEKEVTEADSTDDTTTTDSTSTDTTTTETTAVQAPSSYVGQQGVKRYIFPS